MLGDIYYSLIDLVLDSPPTSVGLLTIAVGVVFLFLGR